jgi:hypothetical protein
LLNLTPIVASCDATISQIQYTVLLDDDDDDGDGDGDDVDSIVTTSDVMSSLWCLNLTRFKIDCVVLIEFVGNNASRTSHSSM